MKIYSEHLYLDSGVMHDRVHQMAGQDLRPEYTDIRTVPSESADHSYLVGKVRVLTVPHKDADIVEDQTEVTVCSCDDYHFNRSKGFENGEMSVTELGKCKHCIAAYRTEKAKQDEQQRTL